MKKMLFILLLCSFSLVSAKLKRSNVITNNSKHKIEIKIQQEGKLCKKEKTWKVKPGKKKTIILMELCKPTKMLLSVPGKPEMEYEFKGQVAQSMEFQTSQMVKYETLMRKIKERLFYVYWDVTVEGDKKGPFKIDAQSKIYMPRWLKATRIGFLGGASVGGIAIGTAVAVMTLGIVLAVPGFAHLTFVEAPTELVEEIRE